MLKFSVINFRKSLLTWYSKHKRNLPWRNTSYPYKIWLSEIMLQQTTVEVVIPYYNRFLQKLPSLEAVAKASEDELLKLWAGLGYYNRIRNFKKAAQLVISEKAGKIPSTKTQLMELPGLGNYTAAAIASIAFKEPVAVVDGNVIRVITRLKAYAGDIGEAATKQFVQEIADQFLDQKNAGDFNQAMMELGATVCTPKNPACLICPVLSHCRAGQSGTSDKYPIKKEKTKYVDQWLACLILTQGSKFFLSKRKAGEVLGNQWEFPLLEVAREVAKDFSLLEKELKRVGFKNIEMKANLPLLKHSIMNRRMKVYPYLVHSKSKELFQCGGKMVSKDQLINYPLTSVTKKIIERGVL